MQVFLKKMIPNKRNIHRSSRPERYKKQTTGTRNRKEKKMAEPRISDGMKSSDDRGSACCYARSPRPERANHRKSRLSGNVYIYTAFAITNIFFAGLVFYIGLYWFLGNSTLGLAGILNLDRNNSE